MAGSKIPVLEIENLLITDNGRGLLVYNDGTNVHLGQDWTGISGNISNESRTFFPAASSSGWIGVNLISGSTYGPTGAVYYIPLFSNLDTNLSS